MRALVGRLLGFEPNRLQCHHLGLWPTLTWRPVQMHHNLRRCRWQICSLYERRLITTLLPQSGQIRLVLFKHLFELVQRDSSLIGSALSRPARKQAAKFVVKLSSATALSTADMTIKERTAHINQILGHPSPFRLVTACKAAFQLSCIVLIWKANSTIHTFLRWLDWTGL